MKKDKRVKSLSPLTFEVCHMPNSLIYSIRCEGLVKGKRIIGQRFFSNQWGRIEGLDDNWDQVEQAMVITGLTYEETYASIKKQLDIVREKMTRTAQFLNDNQIMFIQTVAELRSGKAGPYISYKLLTNKGYVFHNATFSKEKGFVEGLSIHTKETGYIDAGTVYLIHYYKDGTPHDSLYNVEAYISLKEHLFLVSEEELIEMKKDKRKRYK